MVHVRMLGVRRHDIKDPRTLVKASQPPTEHLPKIFQLPGFCFAAALPAMDSVHIAELERQLAQARVDALEKAGSVEHFGCQVQSK